MSAAKASSVVVSGASSRGRGLKELLTNRKIQIGLVVVLVLALGVGGYFVFRPAHKVVPPKTTNSNVTYLPRVQVDYVQMNDDQLTQKVNYLMGTGQFTEAEKLISIQTDLDTNKNKLQLLATVQTAENKTDEAFKTQSKIVALGNVAPGQYEIIGDRYAAAGDTAQAKTYYQKAIDGYNAQKLGPYQSTVKSIQAKIEALK